ncbi:MULTISPECIES: helix-turn-helix transcriptional regulator [Nocardia]|uniref:helix-turn-helix domain-containing protein n=1 Tax=Nocardia TaxID=1817 RepID=UPI000AAE7369|nr:MULTISPECIES: helix-turn-helix transcriptional regulator [Nocardia]MBF6274180.1 helix-turn-helix domain-containing protein [Nocardia nova]
MMIVSTWTGAEVRALRTVALRLTQEQFAERLGFQPPTIRKWERATHERPVRGDSAAALDVELSRLTDEQQDRFTVAVAPDELPHRVRDTEIPTCTTDNLGEHEELSTYGIEDEVKRREFGVFMGVAALTAAADAPRFSHTVGVGDARRLAERVTELARREQAVGGTPLVMTGLGDLAIAKRLLETGAFSDRAGCLFMSAAGELATITGWMAYDADLHPLARQCCADAFALANQAGDNDLTVHVCLNAAHQSIALSRTGDGSPHRALAHLERARQLTRGRPPGRIHALIAIREALAHAILRDRVAFDRAVATAWRELDAAIAHEPLSECPRWLRFVNASEIRSQESRGLGDLGEPEKALALLVADEDTAETGIRNRANYRAGLAAALGRTGDINNAVAHGLSVLTELESTVSSTRTLRLLAPVRAITDSIPDDEFARRYDNLQRRAIGVS